MISIDIDDEKLKHELQRVLNKIYQTESFNISDLNLTSTDFSTRNDLTFNLKIGAYPIERITNIPFTNLTIKQSTIDKLEEDQKKHGFKSIETMIASVLEKHYDSIWT